MPQQEFSIISSKNEGLLFSPSELLEQYLWGIPTCSPNGVELTKQTIKEKIQIAQSNIETWLSILFNPQIITEDKDFIRTEYENSWGLVRVSYPVVKTYKMYGFINQTQQIQMPDHWQSTTKNGDNKTFSRNIYIVPASSGNMSFNSASISGISPHLGWFGSAMIPNYWKMSYQTGFPDLSKVLDVVDYVGKYASIPILSFIGDVAFGIGFSNQNVSIDGISQSISLLKSQQGGIFQGRINAILMELRDNYTRIDKQYRGIIFNVF